MRKVLLLFFALICVITLSWSYFYWPSLQHSLKRFSIDKTQEIKDIARTKELLSHSKAEEALAIIQHYSDDIDNRTEEGKEWLDLLIRASEATSNIQQLTVLYEYYPKSFDGHEKAAMLVGDAFLGEGRSKDYETLRESWRWRETKSEAWFVLDADKLLVEGKRKEAIDFLNSRTFPGKADTQRLVRLALLYIFEQPKIAWDYLSQAYSKDPQNPEIRSYRAKLLETVGKNSLALTEYIGATQIDPKNLYLKDQLIDFYLRQKQYPQALQALSENLNPPSLDIVWIKALFWNRVVTPIKFDWNMVNPPETRNTPYIDYLLSLRHGEFWDAAAFEKLPEASRYLKTQQTSFWLRLLAYLKEGKEKEAYDLLNYNPFHTLSWNPKLEETLKSILLYRKTGSFVDEKTQIQLEIAMQGAGEVKVKPVNTSKDESKLFVQLEFLKLNPHLKDQLPSDLKELLLGSDVFAAVFLAANWPEAAIQLRTLDVIPPTYPDWYGYELTQAIRQNRGTSEAMAFANKQMLTPALSLLSGEMLAAVGKTDEALDHFVKLAEDHDEVGVKASWMTSLIYIDRGQYQEAKAAIEAQPALMKELLGQETLARIALLQGDTAAADQLYTTLEGKSAEAKSYLARKAFAEKNWKKARELTEQLLVDYPTNTLLQDNLKKISEEQNKTKALR